MPARVATASETVACERATIDAGTSAQELMERAGRAAAAEISRRYAMLLPSGAAVFVGPGNNGGDGWVVARCLAENGFPVTVIEAAPAKTAEAQAAAEHGGNAVNTAAQTAKLSDALVIIDALLGTGAAGAPRDPIASAIDIVNNAGEEGALVVSLDIPSGLDATTGARELCVKADLTLTFGVAKRGHLLAREVCGELNVLDIGLKKSLEMEKLPLLVDRSWVTERIPQIPADAHKGTRKRLAILGGGEGMAGAAILAGKGALRSGIGLVKLVVKGENAAAVHAALPEVIVQPWPSSTRSMLRLTQDTDAIAIGPGLGKSAATRDLVERVLLAWNGPVVIDADALNDFSDDAASLAKLLRGRPAIITPHPAELGRLLGKSTEQVVANRFEIGAQLASDSGAAVLLKGSPTVIFAPNGERFVSAAGTAALATGGSGDVLTGIVGTLLAQLARNGPVPTIPVAEIAAVAAFIHGRAAELCGPVRGTTLEDILLAMSDAWNEEGGELPEQLLACIPPVP
jgi:NAD(P)H-hydrate epimerase